MDVSVTVYGVGPKGGGLCLYGRLTSISMCAVYDRVTDNIGLVTMGG
jgi:hypothetical protein